MELVDNLEASYQAESLLEMSMKEIDDDSFSSDEESSEHFKDKLITLKWLSLREKQLKIAICYEKLKKEVEVIKDIDLLSEKIAALQNELKDLNGQNIDEIQFNDILHSITSRKALPPGHWRYSEQQRKTINALSHEEKKLKKQKSIEQKKSASIEDRIFKLNQGIFDSRNTKKGKKRDVGNRKTEEIKKLRSETKQVFDRIQVLSKVTVSLIGHHLLMDPSSKNNILLARLQDVCERVQESHFDDPKNLRDLLNVIKSVEI